ncbi:MAG: prepilin-type N-terminal cleavage/methylation domain-containing protein [Luteitalea sp.]|nr:prepilin-type N-terminal cleavage/methylation domain-containing protein [Luteitalea sp.]
MRRLRLRGGEQGYTFVELLIVALIVLILASVALPLTRVVVKRQKEVELRRALREMRTAIDRYKDAADMGLVASTELEPDDEGYPKTLEVLVEGVGASGANPDRKLKFLRRVPFDPMIGEQEWGLRSYQDDSKSNNWGGENVFDVYTASRGTALDGSKYNDW